MNALLSEAQAIYDAAVRDLGAEFVNPRVSDLLADNLDRPYQECRELAAQINRVEPCGDCGALGQHHCPAWCDVPGCDTTGSVSSCHQRTGHHA